MYTVAQYVKNCSRESKIVLQYFQRIEGCTYLSSTSVFLVVQNFHKDLNNIETSLYFGYSFETDCLKPNCFRLALFRAKRESDVRRKPLVIYFIQLHRKKSTIKMENRLGLVKK